MMESIEPLILSEKEIESVALPLNEVIRIVEETLRMEGQGKVEVPTKIGVHPDHPHSFLHAMPAWVSGARALGMKWVSYYPGNLEKGFPDSTAMIILNHPDHGLPVAIMAGMWITYARTAACAAVAAKYLAPPNPTRLGLVGCGGLGKWSLQALTLVYPMLQEVYVASRTEQSRRQFCSEMSQRGSWQLKPVDQVQDAVRDMDIVVSSTPKPSEPPVKGMWWQAHTLAILLDVLGGWDDRAFHLVERLVTDNYEGLQRIQSRDRPELRLPERWDSLSDVVLGKAPGRKRRDERLMAIPTGIASFDMTVGWEIYRRAQAAGMGVRVRLS